MMNLLISNSLASLCTETRGPRRTDALDGPGWNPCVVFLG